MEIKLTTPIADDDIRALKIGDSVLLSGTIVTGRDRAHKWLIDTFIDKTEEPTPEDEEIYQSLKQILSGGVIYHCGPVVAGLDTKQYRFVAAGPTTSIREEPYQGKVMKEFDLKGVIGKGGMADLTLKACTELPAVYLHAIGGAASLIAESVKEVKTVFKLEFGVPEALWVIEVEDFPMVVTMDSHGNSLHDSVRERSKKKLDELLSA